MTPAPASTLILFDGVCNFCCFWVQGLIRRDPGKQFRFAPLQSAAGQAALRRLGLPVGPLTTMVVVDGDRCYTKSSAALQIARRLGGLWPLLGIFRLVPAPIRDLLYDLIARHRYRWFGQRSACLAPTPALRERFVE